MAEQVIDLSTLTTAQGFVIIGDAAGDRAGYSVSDAGDVNGDGIDDLIVGAYRGSDGGTWAGEAYVIFGRTGPRGPLDLTGLAAADGFAIIGDVVEDQLGWSVSGAGDVNGDGIDDLIVGAPLGDDGGYWAGQAYVIYGSTGSRGPLDLTGIADSDGFAIIGDAPGDYAGFSVSGAGDVNGDGIDDVIVGAWGSDDGGASAGEAYIVYGRTGTRGPLDLTDLAAADGFAIIGDAPGDRAGRSVSGAGDINGDGIADLIVGAPYGDDGGTSAGEAYVIFGRAGPRGPLDLTNLLAADGFAIIGDAEGEFVGYSEPGFVGFSVSGAGDVNGDGIDDMIVGAFRGDIGGFDAGEAYVIYGRTGTRGPLDLGSLASTDGFAIIGDVTRDYAGNSVSGAGDVNGDGIDDLIVGARNGDDGGNNAGEAYVIYGRTGTRGPVDLSSLIAGEGFAIVGDVAEDRAGWSVSGAGDVNGDGAADLIVGAPFGADGGNTAGEAYVIYAGCPGHPGVTITGTEGNDTVTATRAPAGQPLPTDGDDTVIGLGGNDKLDAGGGNDTYIGGAGNDTSTIGDAGDVVIEEAGGGTDTMQSAVIDFVLAADVEKGKLTGGRDLDITGNNLANTLTGNSGDNRLAGDDGNDKLNGKGGDDVLVGGSGKDTLNGGAGTDVLTGGTGADQFKFDKFALDGSVDVITDFSTTDGDRISVSAIDANGSAAGNGKFVFIGTDGFSGAGGELRYEAGYGTSTSVQLDIDGDGVADLVIEVAGTIEFVAGDFIL